MKYEKYIYALSEVGGERLFKRLLVQAQLSSHTSELNNESTNRTTHKGAKRSPGNTNQNAIKRSKK